MTILRPTRNALLAALIAVPATIAGCSSPAAAPPEETTNQDGDTLTAPERAEIARGLDSLAATYERCSSDGTCSTALPEDEEERELAEAIIHPANRAGASGVHPNGLFDFLSNRNACNFLIKLKNLQHPYFFIGTYGAISGVGFGGQAGVDTVWDLWNQQAAVFLYKGLGFTTSIGGEVGKYKGWGFGNKPDVITAWSGRFYTATITGNVPGVNIFGVQIGAGLAGFTDGPQFTIWGGAAVASIGLGISILPPVLPGSFSATAGDWKAYDAGTQAVARSEGTPRVTGSAGKQYIQYVSGWDQGSGILASLGPSGAFPAAAAGFLGVFKSKRWTIQDKCGGDRRSNRVNQPSAPVAIPAKPRR
jgi:hypothetical protein